MESQCTPENTFPMANDVNHFMWTFSHFLSSFENCVQLIWSFWLDFCLIFPFLCGVWILIPIRCFVVKGFSYPSLLFFIFTFTFSHVYMCMCMYDYACLCECMWLCVFVWVCLCMSKHVSICLLVCVCGCVGVWDHTGKTCGDQKRTFSSLTLQS